uniref:Uncharacterized protein n=1 Tax=Ananas comosus var. bracteatus TaxID=296719 RepID=A0A6V7NIG4_ANACO|nr:unnamed protein product [Ananas comosus var. bracteatus]
MSVAGARYNITADHCSAHLDLAFKFHDLTERVDGVLGRTYRKNYTSRAKVGVAMPVLGGDRDQFTASGLFAVDCAVSRFRTGASAGKEYADMHGKSGPEGRGVLLCNR